MVRADRRMLETVSPFGLPGNHRKNGDTARPDTGMTTYLRLPGLLVPCCDGVDNRVDNPNGKGQNNGVSLVAKNTLDAKCLRTQSEVQSERIGESMNQH